MVKIRNILFTAFSFLVMMVAFTIAPRLANGQSCIGTNCVENGACTISNSTCYLSGLHTFTSFKVVNGGVVKVTLFDGTNKTTTGNLQIRADVIQVDATSKILADGSGYQPQLCDDGPGPNATAGGRGGCSVRDSGGGGAHFGIGGRGTKDCFIYGDANTCQFPQEFEESCGHIDTSHSQTCASDSSSCYNNDALPTIAGQPYQHSIYKIEFGAAGGDKGCRDGDGWGCLTAGGGGGRIVLAGVNAAKTGTLTIEGRVSAEGKRGCGYQNDSAGGGAGGALLLVGDLVTVTANAYISAAGGLGGDTRGNSDGNNPDCATSVRSCFQQGGTCDDCGGGGGGGIISVLSRQSAQIASTSVFNVRGALGGTCPICQGEAGGGAGELQLSGVYTGEFCDSYDNDFDGQVDEELGNVSCGTGACQTTVQLCNVSNPNDVFPNDCIPQVNPVCLPALTDTRSRFLVIVDTSGSMLTDLRGYPTFGDGSEGHLGLDTNNDGKKGNDSRLYMAKNALTKVVSAYPEIDYGLARYAQGVGKNVNCQLAHWFECANLCCTYDDPTNNTGTNPEGPCTVNLGGLVPNVTVLPTSKGEECINYAGSCGSIHRGADILVGFEKPLSQFLMWLNHKETNFITTTTEGNHCSGGDCELRATGPTPLADSLYAAKAYLARIRAQDVIGDCRNYGVILLTDGAETCMGDPKTASAKLLAELGIETYVIGFSVVSGEQNSLNQIARAGSKGSSRDAFFVQNEQELTSALASIIAKSVRFELCNNKDDDCDTLIDEDFPMKGQPCNNNKLGVCYRTGTYVCKADGSGVECNAPDARGTDEVCNSKDDDCDGQIDEDLPNCIPPLCQPEVCNGKDDDCDNKIDNDIPSVPCGKDLGECKPGMTECVDGKLICNGGTLPQQETCNGLDDDCDGQRDGMSEACYSYAQGCDLTTGKCIGTCKLGAKICNATEDNGVWKGVWGNCIGDIGPDKEVCDGQDNNCDGLIDEEAECPGGSKCVNGKCSGRCVGEELGCPFGQICRNGWCIVDPCVPEECSHQIPGGICKGGECVDPCLGVTCGKWEKCQQGACVDESCYSNGCPSDEKCIQGVCQPHPCRDVTCGDNEFCQAGECISLCEPNSCGFGEICKVVEEGGQKISQCVADVCAAVKCPSGQVCQEGTCIDDPCNVVQCPKGQICMEGKCAEDLCEVIYCPSWYHCQNGMCIRDSGNATLTAGSGGFTCTISSEGASGTNGLWFMLSAFVLGLLRRRIRRSS